MSIDPRRTGAGAAILMAQIDGGEYAAKQGHGVCGWANEVTPGLNPIVLTNAQLVYNVPQGRKVMVTQYCYAVETASDNCQFEFGYTTGADGTGTFYPQGPHKHVYTGASNTGRTAYDQDIHPPMVLAYSKGVRSITFRVDANDANCEITVGWHGWWEEE